MTDFKKQFDEIYELGYNHGYSIGTKDAQIEQLKKEIEEL